MLWHNDKSHIGSRRHRSSQDGKPVATNKTTTPRVKPEHVPNYFLQHFGQFGQGDDDSEDDGDDEEEGKEGRADHMLDDSK